MPKIVKQLRGFLGLTSYYRRFVKGYRQIAQPLVALYKSSGILKWTTEADAAFKSLKVAMTKARALAMPNFSQEFIIKTDAFGNEIGAVLMQ